MYIQIIFQTPATAAEWKKIAKDFETRWHLPHAIGAIDGKHVRMQCPPNAGSMYYNYKAYHSMVLMAVCDADYKFLYVDVGAMGQSSDGGVWKRCSLYGDLHDDTNPLQIPTPDMIVGMNEPTSYFFIGDDAFPLSTNLLKPYAGGGLSRKQRVYNYRLCRGRRIIENTFGIMCAKFQIFHKAIRMLPEGVERVITACTALHNFLRVKCGKTYMPSDALDREEEGREVPGAWRRVVPALQSIRPIGGRNTYVRAKNMRDSLSNYFVTKEGEIPWQYSRAYVEDLRNEP